MSRGGGAGLRTVVSFFVWGGWPAAGVLRSGWIEIYGYSGNNGDGVEEMVWEDEKLSCLVDKSITRDADESSDVL